ncbi:hypothetical protein BH23PLA1_BH23PLA1_07280 [soil metagenome]
MSRTFLAICGALLCTVAGAAEPVQVRGDYIEARTADVYTGPCFSNSEVFIVGDQAVMAWKVTEGSWNGVDLSGLSIAAAVRATSTFSEDRPSEAQSVLIVDQAASAEQQEALIAMARALAGDRLNNVVAVKTSLVSLTVETHEDGTPEPKHAHAGMPQTPRAAFWAPGLAEVVTRSLCEDDHICGNEDVAYPPLSRGVEVLPAYTLGHHFKGEGLNARWNDPNCRSSFVGHFAL